MAYTTSSFDDEIVARLSKGQVGVLPTDTIYGLSCQALNKDAVERIYEIKGRDTDKPFIILVSDLKMLDLLSIFEEDMQVVNKYWPGPLTIVFPAPSAPDWLQLGLKSLAVRMPKNPKLLKLINEVGPIISTSANFNSHPPVHSVAEAKELFKDSLDFYVDFGQLDNLPSTIAKSKDGKLEVIRQGAVKI